MYNCVITGIYATNQADACLYQTQHSEAEIVVVENADILSRFDKKMLPKVKAYVVWGDKKVKTNVEQKVYLWTDFMKLGEKVPDSVIAEKV